MYIGACNELRVDTKRTEIMGEKILEFIFRFCTLEPFYLSSIT
jgi:hypothetical protein